MKTIELICGGTKAQFTTKSVTLGGNEYFYSRMSDVSHNADECYYIFKYNGQSVKLPYENKDSKILTAIFNQVIMLTDKKAPARPAESVSSGSEPTEPAAAPVLSESSEGNFSETAEETEKQNGSDNEGKNTKTDSGIDDSTSCGSRHNPDPVRQARLKKSFIVFGIIIIIFAAAAAITGFFFGTSDSPSNMSPNSTESQQYDDIDDIINDLQ